MRYCLLVLNENGEGLDYVSQNGESVAINNKTCVFEIDNGDHANEQCSWLLKVQTAWADMANV